jgi:hypothetical protein
MKKTQAASILSLILLTFGEKKGNEFIFLFGIKKFAPADLIIDHVDLSVVPDAYLEFANQYPLVLNGTVKDVRKSTFSKHLVTLDDPHEEKVSMNMRQNLSMSTERGKSLLTQTILSLIKPTPRMRND